MTTTNRGAQLNKLYKVLKRTHKYVPIKGDQPLMETLLLASCLENAHYQMAVDVLAKVGAAFFDWNEIRVSTVKELAEVMHQLPDANDAAARLKGILQSVFESEYSFELEQLKKQNIGVAVKRLQKLQGSTPFNVAYGTQMALGGHSIPVDKGTLGVLYVLGVIGEAEVRDSSVPGMERAIPKSKGQEFGALLHELGADYFTNPFSPSLRELLLSIAPDAKDRFPKRTPKKPVPPPAPRPPAKAALDGKKKSEKLKPEKPEKVVARNPSAKPTEKAAARPVKPTIQPAKKKPARIVKKSAAKTLAKRKPR